MLQVSLAIYGSFKCVYVWCLGWKPKFPEKDAVYVENLTIWKFLTKKYGFRKWLKRKKRGDKNK